MQRIKSVVAMGFVVFMVAFLITGCKKTIDLKDKKSKEDTSQDIPGWRLHAKEKVEFDWYINFSWYSTPWGKNVVSKAITEETGVSIHFMAPMGNETEKLNSMIASNTLPDIITLGWWEDQAQEMIQKDMVYALNKLADQYDPYFYKVTDEQVVDWYRKEDGNLYCYPNCSISYSDFMQNDTIGSNLNFLVRKDIYEAIGSPDMTTPEGFAKAVKRAVELYPTVDGEPLIPIGCDEFTMEGCNSFDKYLQNFLAIPYEKEGVYYDRYTDPEYIRWLKCFRKLNEEGYLSKDIFIDKRFQLEEKMSKGRYFCLLYQGTDIQAAQKILYKEKSNKYYLAVDGPKNSRGDNPMLPSAGISGWTVTFISKNCKNPDRALEFFSYMISDHGQKRVRLGVEGVTYDMVKEKPVIRKEVLYLLNKDRNQYDEIYGADNAYWMFMDNVEQSSWGVREQEPLAQLRGWTYPYVAYTGQYEIVLKNGTQAASAEAKIQEEWGKVLPQLLLASSEGEFHRLFHEFKEKRKALGYQQVMEELTKQMIQAKGKMGIP